MNYLKKWKIMKELGEGGQGKVHLVCKTKEYEEVQKKFIEALQELTSSVTFVDSPQSNAYGEFQKILPKILWPEYYALKVLHDPQDSRNPKSAEDRIKREIKVMSNNFHPNLIKLEDVDPDGKWYVSRYYSEGTLKQKMDNYKGNFLSVLKAIRPLVAGVAELHKQSYVHRDIKPQNIFIGPQNEMVLGDFGLIHFDDTQHTRISETYENVGTRDWMPGWAMGMRIEEIKPTFDVFSLGKLIWSMTSGKPVLQLWYFDRDRFNVEKMFPQDKNMKWANRLFKKCIVENEHDCLSDAGVLLQEIDKTIHQIECVADYFGQSEKRQCRVCGIGEYDLITDGDINAIRNFGINPAGSRRMKIFSCTYCGNVQMFTYKEEPLPAWQN